MTIGIVLLIDVIWIVGLILLFIVLNILDKKYKFYNHHDWNDLGRIIMHFFIIFVPVVAFTIGAILNYIIGYRWVIVIAVAVLLLPIIYLLIKILYYSFICNPSKMAEYTRNRLKGFSHYRENCNKSTLKNDKHAAESGYIYWQINQMEQKMGRSELVYKILPYSVKKKYFKAIVENSRNELRSLKSWEYHADLFRVYYAVTDIYLYFDDGKKSIARTYLKKKDFTRDELSEEDKHLYDYSQKLNNITITGRLSYIFMCIEKYLINLYPQKDWTPVARRMWNITKDKDHLSEGSPGNSYREIVPSYIMKLYKNGYGYDKVNSMVFEGKLEKDTYDEIRALYDGIYAGDPDEEINKIIRLIDDFVYCCKYFNSDFLHYDERTIKLCMEADSILINNGIELPDLKLLEPYKFNRKRIELKYVERVKAFGFGVDAAHLSQILKSE